MEKRQLEVGDVVQVDPEKQGAFGGCLLVVTEPKSFGAQGYILSPYNFDAVRCDGIAYLRVNFADIEYVGKIQWAIKKAVTEHSKPSLDRRKDPQGSGALDSPGS